MASSVYTMQPAAAQQQASTTFARSFSESNSFDGREASFSSSAPGYNSQQQVPYTNAMHHSHTSSRPSTSMHASFGELNGQMSRPMEDDPQIYTAVYSSIPVYEMEIEGVAVMRRRADSWLNATQILKVAGVEKGKRTKILEKEILVGNYEKVQGGYGKYQGTWINYKRGREFCRQYGVEDLLRPLLDYDLSADGHTNPGQTDTPTKEQAMAANRKRLYTTSIDRGVNGSGSNNTFFQNISPVASTALAAMNKANRFETPMARPGSVSKRPSGAVRRPSQQQSYSQESIPYASQQSMRSFASDGAADGDFASMSNSQEHEEPPRKKVRASFQSTMDPTLHESAPTEVNDSFYQDELPQDSEFGHLCLPPLLPSKDKIEEEKRLALEDLFVDGSRTDFSSHTAILHLSSQDLDITIDNSANTALHWAATLGNVALTRLLVSKGANIFRGNAAGQTALMAAVQVNNCLDRSCFPELLEILGPLIELRDVGGRTVLHHIAVASGIKGRIQSSRYYLESLLEFVVRQGSASQTSFDGEPSRFKPPNLSRLMSEVVNVQDKGGNTALNLAARIGIQPIIDQLEEIGADFSIANQTGFQPKDFGVLPKNQSSTLQTSNLSQDSNASQAPSQFDRTREELVATVTTTLSQFQGKYAAELAQKQALVDTQNAEIRDIAQQHKEELAYFEALSNRAHERADREQKIQNLRRIVNEQHTRLTQQGSPLSSSSDKENIDVDAKVDAKINANNLPTASNTPLTSQQKAYISSLPSANVLRARVAAYNTNNAELEDRIQEFKSRSSELEAQYRKVVSLCSGVDEDKVEDVLESLVAAVESEDALEGGVEVSRVRDILRKVEGVDP